MEGHLRVHAALNAVKHTLKTKQPLFRKSLSKVTGKLYVVTRLGWGIGPAWAECSSGDASNQKCALSRKNITGAEFSAPV